MDKQQQQHIPILSCEEDSISSLAHKLELTLQSVTNCACNTVDLQSMWRMHRRVPSTGSLSNNSTDVPAMCNSLYCAASVYSVFRCRGIASEEITTVVGNAIIDSL